ncbi:trans-aconitate 2-methyltransferase [Gilvimarinus gilvus]|uniref:trans-aconitate 2-methyltransferase n=1 Tax=Gilvimarinus gilvus TaxID=3058038 RepID=UPI0034A03144
MPQFDKNAENYLRYRPDVDSRILPWVLEHCGLAGELKILEIGCGAGQATNLFQSLAPSQLCIDPGARLLKLSEKRFPDRSHYQFQNVSFEALNANSAFDVIYAATSFHWLAGC